MDVRLNALSSICGWLYFLAWSASFYAQPLLNIRRRSTEGFLIDHSLLNVVGFTCYIQTTSTSALLLLSTVRSQYALRHPSHSTPTVRPVDFAFSCHALVLSAVTLSQFLPRIWGWKQDSKLREHSSSSPARPTRPVRWLLVVVGLSILGSIMAALVFGDRTGRDGKPCWEWLDVITTLSLTKVLLTITKYIPQALSHTRSRSTLGFSITQVLLDTAGGLFSLAQLLLDSYGSGSGGGGWAAMATSLADNPGKLGLAGVSLFFDAVFVVQHFVLYGPVRRSWREDDDGVESDFEEGGERRALLG